MTKIHVSKRSSRHKEREKALQKLYGLDISSGGKFTGVGRQTESRSISEGGPPEKPASYGNIIGEGVMSNLTEIDRFIDGASKNWSLTRMTVVDRNILRMAVYELLYHLDVPYKVVMDQAVELAGRFGSENSPSFINGIIDNVYKKILSGRHPSKRDIEEET